MIGIVWVSEGKIILWLEKIRILCDNYCHAKDKLWGAGFTLFSTKE